jgi:hypothetical protein
MQQVTVLKTTKGQLLMKFIKGLLAICGVIIVGKGFSFLATVHSKDTPESYFSAGPPSIMALLDSEFFMGLIFVITLAIVVYVLYLFWQLHEVAVNKAQAMSSAHTQIVFALSLCGLFIDKAWWVVAIIIAFARWDLVSDRISKIINDGIKGNQS